MWCEITRLYHLSHRFQTGARVPGRHYFHLAYLQNGRWCTLGVLPSTVRPLARDPRVLIGLPLPLAFGFWSGRALATGTALAGLCLIHHHHRTGVGVARGAWCKHADTRTREERAPHAPPQSPVSTPRSERKLIRTPTEGGVPWWCAGESAGGGGGREHIKEGSERRALVSSARPQHVTKAGGSLVVSRSSLKREREPLSVSFRRSRRAASASTRRARRDRHREAPSRPSPSSRCRRA